MNNNVKFDLVKTKIYISFPFLAVLSLMFLMDNKGNSLNVIIALILHELAHILAIITFGGKIIHVKFSLCEVDIKTEKEILRNWQKLIVSVNGALMNFVLAGCFWNIYPNFASVNIIIGCFQLLPVTSLDGDDILVTLGVKEKLRKILSFIVAFLIAVLGFYVLIQTKYNFSVLVISLYLISLTCKTS